MQKSLASVCFALLCVCHVQAATPICLNADWVQPEGVHPLWKDWMAGTLIRVTLGGATTLGHEDTVKETTIDYEAAHGSIELDFTGLAENTLWVVFASIKSQVISSPDGSESVVVSAPMSMEFHNGLDGQEYPFEYSFPLTLRIAEVE